MTPPWPVLEQIPGLTALAPRWQELLGENFGAFQLLCLIISSTRHVHLLPCPRAKDCAYRIIPLPQALGPGSIHR